MNQTSYLDLKAGSRLILKPEDIEVLVQSVDDGHLVLRVRSLHDLLHHTRVIGRKQTKHIGNVLFYNHGNRGYGRRCHVRLELPRGYRYDNETKHLTQKKIKTNKYDDFCQCEECATSRQRRKEKET